MNARLLLLSTLLVLFISACQPINDEEVESTSTPPKEPIVDSEEPEWVFSWETVEARTIELRNHATTQRDPNDLYQLKYQLLSPPNRNGSVSEDLRIYWYAFASLNLILVEERLGALDQVKRLLDETIQVLEDLDPKSVEVHALLAILYRLNIEHETERTFELVLSMQDHLDSAIELDPDNLRTLVAQTLVAVRPIPGFGISADVDETVQKALSASTVNDSLPNSPTWGIPLIYLFWIEWLSTQDQYDKLMREFNRAKQEFPDDAFLRESLNKMIENFN